MDQKFMDLVRELNKRSNLPETALRRNSVYYKLVSYINNSIALFISEDYDGVALFVMRAYKELDFLKTRRECRERYFILIAEYMAYVSHYMMENNLLSDSGTYFLPEEFKNT